MSKSRKRTKSKKKNNGRRPKPYQVVDQQFVKMNNLFPEDVPFETRLQTMREIGRKAISNFEEEYQKLDAYLNDYDQLYLCSFCARYFVSAQEGIDEEAINGFIDFPDFFLEILQCLSLTRARNLSSKPLDQEILNFKSTLSNFCRSQGFMHFNYADKVKTLEDIDVLMLRVDMMGHTTAVRNWAYPYQMQKIAYDLADLVEPAFSLSQGFKSKDFLDLLFSLIPLVEEKLNIHISKTREFIRAKTYNQVFDKYEDSFPHVIKTESPERERVWDYVGRDIKSLKGLLLAHSDLFLSDVFTFSSKEIHDHLDQKLSEQEICDILDKLSFQFGDLKDINKEHIFLDNPIHVKPFIKVEEGCYFSAIPHMFIHLGVDLLERLVSSDIKLKNDYIKKKGRYLEAKVETLFKEAFPDAKIFRGSIWRCPITGKDFENDLIILIENFAIIIECKSGTVSMPAKRGAPERLFKTIDELVISPSEQAIRFESYLSQNAQEHKFRTKTKTINTIDSTRIKYYIPLGVTLSNLGSIGCNLKKIINAKVTDRTIEELAPSISLTDLEIIFEILTLRAEKIHYLSRRREFEAHLRFEGDEMDLFGFYLDNGFNIGETEYDDIIFNLTLKSKVLDPYFVGKYRGRQIKKPVLRKSKYWNDILVKLENDSPNWLLISYILLNLPKDDQVKFERNLKGLINRVKKGYVPRPNNWMLMVCGPERRRYAIVGFPYKNIDKHTRNTFISDIIASVEEDKNIRGIVIIGRNLDSPYYPYSMIAASKETDFFDSLESE